MLIQNPKSDYRLLISFRMKTTPHVTAKAEHFASRSIFKHLILLNITILKCKAILHFTILLT